VARWLSVAVTFSGRWGEMSLPELLEKNLSATQNACPSTKKHPKIFKVYLRGTARPHGQHGSHSVTNKMLLLSQHQFLCVQNNSLRAIQAAAACRHSELVFVL